jgi:hypothetical protein
MEGYRLLDRTSDVARVILYYYDKFYIINNLWQQKKQNDS